MKLVRSLNQKIREKSTKIPNFWFRYLIEIQAKNGVDKIVNLGFFGSYLEKKHRRWLLIQIYLLNEG